MLIDALDARGTTYSACGHKKSSCDGRPRGALSALVLLDAVYWRAEVLAFSLQGAGTGSELTNGYIGRVPCHGTSGQVPRLGLIPIRPRGSSVPAHEDDDDGLECLEWLLYIV